LSIEEKYDLMYERIAISAAPLEALYGFDGLVGESIVNELFGLVR
jgi:hypothetical protein